MKKITKDIIEILNYEYELFENSIQEIIEKRYTELYKDGSKNGYYPLILVPSDVLYDALTINLDETKAEDYIGFSKEIDIRKFFNTKRSQYEFDEKYLAEVGEFSDEDSNDYLAGYLDVDTSFPYEEVLILKIPTRNPWEILGHIPMGGYNDCPTPEYQIAAAKYWYEQYKAVPAVISSNTIEFIIENPPQDLKSAEKLAYEHYLFCNDIIDQGIETIRKLASILKNSMIWCFWWE